jgi:hypothetical protein
MQAQTILDRAAQIVDGDREKTYGHPAKNLDTIAEFWTAWLRSRGLLASELASLSFDDVACMMVLLKLARLSNDTWHKDSQIDGAGYLRLLERCQDHIENELRGRP